jgi:hypothetical protein
MSRLALTALLVLTPLALHADGPKPCEELKSEIAKKLDAKNVNSYTLEIVAPEKKAKEANEATQADANGKVVGTCQNGTRQIVYRKEASPPEPAPAAPAQPPH